MLLTKKSVELLAPAGNWETLVAAIDAGADAVYLGGKHFNMRMLKSDANFDNAMLKKAVDYAHAHGVMLYITINNLISDAEIPELEEYLLYLNEIQPDAILIQDLAVAHLVKKLGLNLTMHASIMMNSHNNAAIKKLKSYGIRRVVVSREMSLKELSELKAVDSDFELEYFVHGDMCISESGQCIHSGVLFANSSNRGRCMKACRWPYKIIDEATGEVLDTTTDGDYRLALKDMCMYRNIPDLIQAGVYSFKVEGRMRSAEFVAHIIRIYRKAIDAYVADPTGYHIDEQDWQSLFDNRVRDYSTCFAMDKPDSSSIGYTGKREPRFFSKATKEADLHCDWLHEEAPIKQLPNHKSLLAVKAATKEHALLALANGADILYVGGEVNRPNTPWTLDDIKFISDKAHETGAKVIVNTPRTTLKEQCSEVEQLCYDLTHTINGKVVHVDGIMVGNLGAATLVNETTNLPIYADHSFNIFNHVSTEFLQDNGIVNATASYELPYAQVRTLVESSSLPITLTVHGNIEAMIADSNIPAMNLKFDPLTNPELNDKHFALLDTVGGKHSMRMDQLGRIHILFTHDLCLLPYLDKLMGAAVLRIEAQDYTPQFTGELTNIYRQAIDGKITDLKAAAEALQAKSPRPLGIGAYRFHKSN